jgi:hypothetical protein
VKRNDSSNSALLGRPGRGRGRYLVKTLLPLISDLTSDSKSSTVTNSSTENLRATKAELGLPNAELPDPTLRDEVMQPTLPQESLPRPAKMAKHVGKSIPQHSKSSVVGIALSSRRKSTSLAFEATLAMNVAKEEEQKEKLVSQRKVQLKKSSANVMQSTFPIVSNDEMSDTSFRKQVLSEGDLVSHASHLRPRLNFMCPPPPTNPSAVNSGTNYLNTTWNLRNPTLNTDQSTGATSKPNKVEKRANKSKKLTPQNNHAVMEMKQVPDLSLRDVASSSETDGGLTTDAEKEAANCPLAELDLSEGDRNRLHRDRNKEHARNTRLRKKAYVEKLKATVDDLCRERDSLVQDRATSAVKNSARRFIGLWTAKRSSISCRSTRYGRICES